MFLGSRNSSVAVYNLGEYTAEGFNTQGQRSYVQQQNVFNFACQYASLDSCADCNAFVRVYTAVGFFADEFFNCFLNSRDTGRTAYQDNFVDIACRKACVSHCLTGRSHGTFNKVSSHFFKFSTGQIHVQMFRAVSTCGNERQVDVGGQYAGQFNLSFFSSFAQTLHSHTVNRQVNAFCFFEFGNHPVDDFLVKVIAAQMSITISSFYFKYAVAHFQDGNVEGTAAQVIYENGVVVSFVDTVSKSCSGRFVDDTQNFQTCDFACVFGSLTLAVREVSRNSDNCLGYSFSQIFFCITFQFLQNHCGNFFRRIFFAINFNFVSGAHMTFNGADGSVRIGNSLTFCQLAYQTFAVFGKTNYGRSQTAAFLISDNCRFAAFHNSDNRVCST